MRHAIGGLATTMGESLALMAPNSNSYRRFQPDSFVPLAPTWGLNNRTVALRIPAGDPAATRVEHRVAGADANPYLVAGRGAGRNALRAEPQGRTASTVGG